MPRQKKKMTSFMVAELLEKRKVGHTITHIADYFGIDRATVSYWIKKRREGKSLIPAWPFENSGAEQNGRKTTKEEVAGIIECRKLNWSINRIAREYGMDRKSVRYWLNKNGMPSQNNSPKVIQQQSELNKAVKEIRARNRKSLPETKWERKFYDLYGKIGTEREVAFFKKEYKNSNPFGL